jgi:hypothetical protein
MEQINPMQGKLEPWKSQEKVLTTYLWGMVSWGSPHPQERRNTQKACSTLSPGSPTELTNSHTHWEGGLYCLYPFPALLQCP